MPKRFDTLITVLVKTTLSESTPQQVFQEVMTDDAYREDDEKDELIKKKKKDGEKKMMRRRKVWHSRPPHPRAKPSKNHQVKKKQALVIVMKMRRWLFLSKDLESL